MSKLEKITAFRVSNSRLGAVTVSQTPPTSFTNAIIIEQSPTAGKVIIDRRYVPSLIEALEQIYKISPVESL